MTAADRGSSGYRGEVYPGASPRPACAVTWLMLSAYALSATRYDGS